MNPHTHLNGQHSPQRSDKTSITPFINSIPELEIVYLNATNPSTSPLNIFPNIYIYTVKTR